ncbi:MAG TPA: polysaccharide biosynthesis protein, partial [Arcobacter sp.]|nr:polysaccharide biosynthesis protein [Arcobacter sp.]
MVKIFSRTRKFLNKGQTRTILAKKNIFYSFLIKIVNIFVVMATVSLSIKLLGAENYGIWIVLSGIITWSNLFNFGFSNGLRNKLGEVLTNGNTSVGQYYVSTTYAFLFIISFIMYMLFFSLANTFDWVNVLNIKNVDNNYIVSLLLIIFSFFCFKFILGPINAILEAHQ